MRVVVRSLGRPLPAHLIELLRTCQELNTTETKTLAAHLGLASSSVNAYFQRIAEGLGTTDRFSSVHQAQRMGYLMHSRENLLVNGDFIEGNCNDAPGNSLPWATVVGWQALCGTPQWVPPASTGGVGAIHFWGAADHGEAISQRLLPAKRLQPGQAYRISMEYCFGPVRRDWPVTPRQPMCVDFRICASDGPPPSYLAMNEPGKIAEIGWMRYAQRSHDHFQVSDRAPTAEEIEEMRRRGGEHLVRVNLEHHRAGGMAVWEWETAVLEWVADARYDTITVHPTNHVVVGEGRPEATYELGWGEVRRLRLVRVSDAGPQ